MANKNPRFGPGGNSTVFNAQYHSKTLLAPEYVARCGLDVYEYEAGQGIVAGEQALLAVGRAAAENGIAVTFHAPYFISLSGVEAEKRINSVGYIENSVRAAKCLGSDIIVVHTGSAAKITRRQAMAYAADTLSMALVQIDLGQVRIGLETMGKVNQLGTLDEVIELCSMDRRLVPVVDFGHMNAREMGLFFTCDDYRRVFDRIGTALGDDTARYLHCHFSKIEYTSGGEKRHLTFEDSLYGPSFEPLMEALVRDDLAPTIICESAGTQDADALAMKECYKSLKSRLK